MKRYTLFRHAIQTLVVFVVFWLARSAEDKLSQCASSLQTVIWALVAIGLVALLWAAEWFFGGLFNYSIWLRRLFLGEDFVEGVWFNVVTLETKVFYGVLHIRLKNDGVAVHGMQYDEEGVIIGEFHSNMSEYHDSTLRYSYLYKSIDPKEVKHTDVQGLEEVTFFKKVAGSPSQYAGRFQDMSPDQTVAKIGVLYGWLVVGKERVKALEAQDARAVVKGLITETKGLLPPPPPNACEKPKQ